MEPIAQGKTSEGGQGGAVLAEGLLATKLYAPHTRTNLVTRPRLIERLDEGARGKLTLLCAPAGSGKTTLLGEELERFPARGVDQLHLGLRLEAGMRELDA